MPIRWQAGAGGGGVKPNSGELSKGVSGPFGELVTPPPTKSYCIATTQRHKTSKRSAKNEQCKLEYEKCTVKMHCQSGGSVLQRKSGERGGRLQGSVGVSVRISGCVH